MGNCRRELQTQGLLQMNLSVPEFTACPLVPVGVKGTRERSLPPAPVLNASPLPAVGPGPGLKATAPPVPGRKPSPRPPTEVGLHSSSLCGLFGRDPYLWLLCLLSVRSHCHLKSTHQFLKMTGTAPPWDSCHFCRCHSLYCLEKVLCWVTEAPKPSEPGDLGCASPWVCRHL